MSLNIHFSPPLGSPVPFIPVRAGLAKADHYAITVLNILGLTLMETAGHQVALQVMNLLEAKADRQSSILVFAGPGNNGGDGFVCARYLKNAGYESLKVMTLVGYEAYQGDALTNLEALSDTGIPVIETPEDSVVLEALSKSDMVVDALFGTGLSRPLTDKAQLWVEALNASGKPILSVDIPSGLNEKTGQPMGVAVKATKTVTFQALKAGLVLSPAPEYTGSIVVVDIGLPPAAIDQVAEEGRILTPAGVLAAWPKRRSQDHKYGYGSVLVIGGCTTMPGAPVMSAHAALVAGCGFVRLATPSQTIGSMQLFPECVLAPLHSQERADHLVLDHLDALKPWIQQASTVVLGPGLGQSAETIETVAKLLKDVLQAFDGWVVLDADGLNALAALSHWPSLGPRFVLTPHLGEAARLLGCDKQAIQADWIAGCRALRDKTGATVVLKSPTTLITPASKGTDGEVPLWINPTGNDGMATAGVGDILSGLIAGGLAQAGLPDSFNSDEVASTVASAVYLHGLAGDDAANQWSTYGMVATSLLTSFPRAIDRLTEKADRSLPYRPLDPPGVLGASSS